MILFNKSFQIKKLVPLVFIFLCLKAKAEPTNSAFADNIIVKDSIIQKQYEFVKILFEQKEHAKALKNVLTLAEEKIEDPNLKINVYLLAGRILMNENTYEVKSPKYIKNYERGLVFLKKALNSMNNTSSELGSTSLLKSAEIYHTLSIAYLGMKKIDSSKFYIDQITKINSINVEIEEIKAKAYSNLATINMQEKDMVQAEDNITKAIEIHNKLNNNIALVADYTNLAAIYDLKSDYVKARDLYKKALTYLKNSNSSKAIEYKELLYDNIAWALYNLKDYRAYKYVTESYAIRDSLNEEGLNKQYEEIQAKHNVETVQKAEENKRLRLKYNLERKTWIIGGVGVGVSLLFLFLANLYKLRQRNLSLELSQNELRQQRKLERLNSETQVKILNATMDGKETERKQIAEILHDNVSALLSSANMHLQASHKQFGDDIPIELEKTRQIIVEASQKIRDLSHNLVSSILLKFGLEFAIKDAAKKFSNSEIKINAAVGTIHRYAQDYEIKVFNIVQELINNVLKHSQAKNAYIILEEEDAVLNLIVKDDGIGFDEISEEETGIGLSQIKARIRMMDGQFFIDSTKGKGTKVMVNIPVVPKENMITA